MLLGRAPELARIREVLEAAGRGDSTALVVVGEAGIGKSALLSAAEEAARIGAGPPVTVLRTRGIESEASIPFGGLVDLVRPVRHVLDALPERQATVLRGALALGPPAAADRFSVAAATLGLLAAVAADHVLLCVIDDAHWLDPSSAEALVFAARRMHAEGTVLLFSVRTGTPGAERFLVLDRMPVTGLDVAAAAALLGARTSRPLSPSVLDRLVAGTGGNPLALLELPERLTDDQLGGRTPIVEPLPVGSLLQESFLRRAARLPDSARAALLVAATCDLDLADVVDSALREAGGSLADLEPAESAGLLVLDTGRVDFRHPLIRSAVYHAATPAQRRAAHRHVAEAFGRVAVPRSAERRAWHLAAATTTSDESVALALEEVGRAAQRQHGHAVAARAFERAAALTPGPAARARRLVAAAAAAVPAGAAQDAIRLLEDAGRWSDDPAVTAAAECERLRIAAWGMPTAGHRALLTAFAQRTEATFPDIAVRAYLAAGQASLSDYDAPAVVAATDRAARLRGEDPDVGLFCDVLAAIAAAQQGAGARAAALLARRRDQLAGRGTFDVEQLVTVAGVAHLALERTGEARPLLARAVAASRAAGTAGLLAVQLPWLAALEWQDGDWTAALALAHEAVLLAPETGWLSQLPNSLSTLARVEAGFGMASCRDHAAHAVEAAKAGGHPGTVVHGLAAVGLLELGLGHPDDAADVLADAEAAAGASPVPLLLAQVLPDLVEALVRAGRIDRAGEALARLDALAQRTGRVSALAAAARLHGLLDHAGYAVWFERALAHHATGGSPFEEARTRAAYGSRLRRDRGRAEARVQLSRALTLFERLGAAPWADGARAELLAGGGTAPARRDPVELTLTPQELQVSLAVRSGMTNAAAAASLFLSVKTVEYHLSNIYRKLGVRSRTQLIRVMDGPPVRVQAG